MEDNPRSRNYLLLGIGLIAAVAVGLYLIGRSSSIGGPAREPAAGYGVFIGTGALPPRSPIQPLDPCTLIDSQEVQSLVGVPLGRAQNERSDSPIGPRTCRFPAEGRSEEHTSELQSH